MNIIKCPHCGGKHQDSGINKDWTCDYCEEVVKVTNTKHMKKLKIVYTPKLDKELDKELKELLDKLGWEFQGSGYFFEKEERDLTFTKE